MAARFLFAIHALEPTGAGLGLLELAQHMILAGHRVEVSVSGPADPFLRAELENAGAAVLSGAVQPDRYDAAMLSTVAVAEDVLRVAPHIPVVWRIHEGLSGFNLIYANPRVVHAFKAAHHIVFPHEYCRDNVFIPFLDGLPRHRISIVPSGISLPSEQPDTGGRNGILFVGSLYDRKRPFDLLRAVLSDLSDDVPCRLIGPADAVGADTRDILAANPGRFQVTGPLPAAELANAYHQAAVLALPSGCESFGRAPLEAAAHGCVPVLSDLPVYRDLWQNGRNALLHPVGDTASLGQALRLALGDRKYRRKLADAARKTAQNFPIGTTLERMRLILEQTARIYEPGEAP
ncbi:MAG: glycosyltransferase family 4 protein [Alphaproteobacteria bacterium]